MVFIYLERDKRKEIKMKRGDVFYLFQYGEKTKTVMAIDSKDALDLASLSLIQDIDCDNECGDLIFSLDLDDSPKQCFDSVVRPVMKYMAENHHPLMTTIVTANSAEIMEGCECVSDDCYLVD